MKKIVEEYSAAYVGFENLMILAQVVMGGILLLGPRLGGIPVASVSYGLFAVVMLGFVLRRDLCTHCHYYGKNCHCGWGKLSAALFEKGSGNQKRGAILAGMTWGLLMLVPLGFAVVQLVVFFSIGYAIYLLVFLITVILNLVIHKKDCSECAMRENCPASSAKPKA